MRMPEEVETAGSLNNFGLVVGHWVDETETIPEAPTPLGEEAKAEYLKLQWCCERFVGFH